MMAGKFGIGAKVRDLDGDEGVVIDKRKGKRLVKFDGNGPFAFPGVEVWTRKSHLTLASEPEQEFESKLEPAAPPSAETSEVAFMVGDRVKVVQANFFREGTEVGDFGYVTRLPGQENGNYFEIDLHHPEEGVIEQICQSGDIEPAPLTIEAGKFYMTRDGRNVGPMRVTDDVWADRFGNTAAFQAKSNNEYYTASGLWLARGRSECENDLVAEWPEPAKEEPAPFAPGIGESVILSAPAKITGLDKKNANIVLDTGGSFALPIAALRAA